MVFTALPNFSLRCKRAIVTGPLSGTGATCAVVYLTSDAALLVMASVLKVDGGLSAGK